MSKSINNENDDIFWIDKPSILVDNYLKFIPTSDMKTIQRYNAITLFCIYVIFLFLLFGKNIYWFSLPIFVIIIVIILHKIGNTNSEHFVDDKNKQLNDNLIAESGFMDSNNTIQFSRVNASPTNKPEVSYQCRKPTKDNPFMNPATSEFNTDAPAACNSDDEDIKNEITKSFNVDSYMDIDDIFSKMNSQRQFYTVPNTAIPNNQDGFARWLYLSPTTCKEDQEKCLRYEDLKYKR